MRPMRRALRFCRPQQIALAPTVHRQTCEIRVDRKSGYFWCFTHGVGGTGAVACTQHYFGIDEADARLFLRAYREVKR